MELPKILKKSDIDQSILTISSLFLDKESALSAIDDKLKLLFKIRQYRYNQEEDLEVLRSISLHADFRKLVAELNDWKKEELEKSIIEKVFLKISKIHQSSTIIINEKYLILIDKFNWNALKFFNYKKKIITSILQSKNNAISRVSSRIKDSRSSLIRSVSSFIFNLKSYYLNVVSKFNKPLNLDSEILIDHTPQKSKESFWKLDNLLTEEFNSLNGKLVSSNFSIPNNTESNFIIEDESSYFIADGENFISLPSDSLNFIDDYTVSFDICVPANIGKSGLTVISCFDNKEDHEKYYGWYINYSNSTINVGMGMKYSDGTNFTFGEMEIKDEWVNIVVSRKKSEWTKIYVLGELIAETVNLEDPIYCKNNLAYIGASYYSISSPKYTIHSSGIKLRNVHTFDGICLNDLEIYELSRPIRIKNKKMKKS